MPEPEPVFGGDCPHQGQYGTLWVNNGQQLACSECGTPWPGRPLPEPIHERQGVGEIPAHYMSVTAMIQALREMPDPPRFAPRPFLGPSGR
jgi:hypothetical protein